MGQLVFGLSLGVVDGGGEEGRFRYSWSAGVAGGLVGRPRSSGRHYRCRTTRPRHSDPHDREGGGLVFCSINFWHNDFNSRTI
jgi:hypothetical protein